MSARYAKRIAENKEIDTYNHMSATVLHDLKNAAGHLSLILQNAPRHMNQAEFRNDMLDTISDALARIDKVMNNLQVIPEPQEIHLKIFNIGPFLDNLLDRLRPRLEGIEVKRDYEKCLRAENRPGCL